MFFASHATVVLLTEKRKLELAETANAIRQSVIEMLVAAGSGHTLRHNPKDPFWPDRDRLVLSNGHICPVLYATLAYAGYLPKEELKTLRQFGSRLQGHPYREFLPIMETSSGPLGSGLSRTRCPSSSSAYTTPSGNRANRWS